MNLLILPGGSSPYAKDYKDVYKLLWDTAKSRGYEEVRVALYPGQMDESGNFSGKATLTSSVETVFELINEFKHKGDFRIIARCFGCTVALSAIKNLRTDNLKKIILYSPAPFWLIWQMYKRDFLKSHKIDFEQGVDVSSEYFNSAVPIESLLKDTYNIPIIVSAGEKDDVCPPSLFNYLKDIFVDKKNICFKEPLKECKHTMRPGDLGVREYLDTLFGD